MKFCASILLLVSLIQHISCVEVHFEAADSGFFLKHSRQPPVTPEISNILTSPLPPSLKARSSTTSTSSSSAAATYDSVLSLDRFTVVETTQPVSIRASYGPFSTKQTVPARYIVPDTMDNQGDYLNNTTAALLELQQPNMHLDISAHLVRPNVPQDSPVLRVLFHAGADPGGHLQRQKVCVLLHVSMGNELPLKGRCMPEGEDGVCVAEVVIPSNWWPALPPPIRRDGNMGAPQKVPQRFAQVSYSVFEPPLRNPEQCEPKVQIQPLTTFAQVPLISVKTAFKELRADETLTFLLPQHPLYPMSKLHVPVFLHQLPDQHVAAFTVRARVKSGIRIMGATASTDSWQISIEKENPKHTTARVTAYRKEQESTSGSSMENRSEMANTSSSSNSNTSASKGNGATSATEVFEVFSWLLEVVGDTNEFIDGGKIVWSVTYVYDTPKDKDSSSELLTTDEAKKRLIAKLEINKDDIQAVLPMAKIWELMNTAVLTGRQVAQAMKVFIVSQAGKVADVTLQSSCHAEDESVIKVSSSCSSVYVDGSEIRGSSNASVIVKYGTYVGVAKFIVWMPEFPLEVYISDFRLSQIKGWKVLDDNHYLHKQSRRRKKRSYVWAQHAGGGGSAGGNAGATTNYYNSNLGVDKMVCRARYQQSPVEVYAKFLAIDQNSGRITYFISRRTGLRVTDLVQPLLRVADPKIATLKGRILQGKSMGRTDVQVLSPITGRVIGAKEIRVGSDKVNLSKLIVRVISGLQLTITPDNTIENGYIAETSVTHKLTAQYQEGLLDIDLEFSDGSRTPLRDISVEDYFLLVESLDTEVVAFAPMLASHHPRVIAVGEGNGNLLRVTLLLSEDCRIRRGLTSSTSTTTKNKSHVAPLASALASIEVDFNNIADIVNKQESIQNDGIIGRERKGFRNSAAGDLADIIVGIPLRDSSQHYEPTVQARQHRGSIQTSLHKSRYGKKGVQGDMTSMEVGMYVLLTAFCFAIIVFVISCVVYASKFRPIIIESGLDPMESGAKSGGGATYRDTRLKESTTNAHDWVWLGRSTIDRHSVATDTGACTAVGAGPVAAGGGNIVPRDSRMRITSNPIINYDNGGAIGGRKISSFDQPRLQTHIVPTSSLHRSDSAALTAPEQYALNALQDGRKDKPLEYKPPVPPHRNIGARAMLTNLSNLNGKDQVGEKRLSQHKRDLSHDYKNEPQRNQAAICGMPLIMTAEAKAQHKIANPSQLMVNSGNALHLHVQQSMPQQLLTSPERLMRHDAPTATAAAAAAAQAPPPLPNPPLPPTQYRISNEELHNAEKLVEYTNPHQKNAFQFDSLTPKRVTKAPIPAQLKEKLHKLQHQQQTTTAAAAVNNHSNNAVVAAAAAALSKNSSSSGSKADEVLCRLPPIVALANADANATAATAAAAATPTATTTTTTTNTTTSVGEPTSKSSRIKRATVVGNPMFSATVDDSMPPGESLGLDDLDMDYEQIMHYFDNLKESNA